MTHWGWSNTVKGVHKGCGIPVLSRHSKLELTRPQATWWNLKVGLIKLDSQAKSAFSRDWIGRPPTWIISRLLTYTLIHNLRLCFSYCLSSHYYFVFINKYAKQYFPEMQRGQFYFCISPSFIISLRLTFEAFQCSHNLKRSHLRFNESTHFLKLTVALCIWPQVLNKALMFQHCKRFSVATDGLQGWILLSHIPALHSKKCRKPMEKRKWLN